MSDRPLYPINRLIASINEELLLQCVFCSKTFGFSEARVVYLNDDGMSERAEKQFMRVWKHYVSEHL